MGILGALLGQENPFAQWASQNSNWLGAVGSGIGNGLDTSQLGEGKRLDYIAQQQRDAEAKVAAQANSTKNWLQQHHPDLAQMVDAGMPVSEAWQTALTRQQPQAKKAPIEINGQLVDPDTYQVVGDYRTPDAPAQPDYPAGVQEYQFAKGQGYTGSYTDFQKEMKAAGRPAMNATTQKELFDAEDAAKSGEYVLSALDQAIKLNDTAYDGPLADWRGKASALMGDQAGVATAQLQNITTETALSQLKTIFGAAPTEGERQILLDLQGSVNQPKAVRAAIYQRAAEMAQRRMADNKAKAEALRSGQYFDPGYGQQAAPGGGVDDILTKYGL